jgi:hypothetical protein
MASLAHDPARRQVLGANGRRLVQRTYNWATIVKSWLNELEAPKETTTFGKEAFVGVSPASQVSLSENRSAAAGQPK